MAESLKQIEAKLDCGEQLRPSEIAELFAHVEACAKRLAVSEFLFPARSQEDALQRIVAYAELRERIDEVIEHLELECT